MHLQESGEMYLETIYVLSLKGKAVRSIDIAEEMRFSKPSVSRAVGILKKGGFLTVEDGGNLHLTEDGEAVAKKIYERHTVLSEVLTALGVTPEVAANDACKIEHVISDESFYIIKEHAHRHLVQQKSKE